MTGKPGIDRTGWLQRWIEARWYGGAPVPAWLSALSRLFAIVARHRRARQRSDATRLPVPVVVVGNLTVGGSGKTPVVIALVESLRASGFTPGVISRGYGSSARGVRDVDADDDPSATGDEPLLIARRTGVPVVVGRDRVGAARRLIGRHGVDVVVSDDGLQHYRLARDLEIVVVDGRRRFGNGRLLPAGPLREPLERLDEAGIVLVNGPRGSEETGFDLALGSAWSLAGHPGRMLSSLAGTPVHAVAGIGDPVRFFDALRAKGFQVIEHAFPDHHAFVPDDLAFTDGHPVLMTEKDAVKCRRFARPDWYAVPVTAELPTAVVEKVSAILRSLPDPALPA